MANVLMRNYFVDLPQNPRKIRLTVFGCPHLTIVELGKLAAFLEGRIVKEGSYLMVGVSNPTYALAKDAGLRR